METFRSNDGTEAFSFECIQPWDDDERGCYNFTFHITSHDFSVKASIAITERELLALSKSLFALSEGKAEQAKLEVFSMEFGVEVFRKDALGHFWVSFDVANGFYDNPALLNTDLNTQDLISLTNALLRAARKDTR